MKIEKNGVITNGTNVLTMAELGMDEPGSVIRIPLSRVANRYGLSIPDLLRGVDLDWLLAAVNDEDYRDVVIYIATHTYVAANAKACIFVLQYTIDDVDARRYMSTGDTDVSAAVLSMDGMYIDDNIDLSD